MDISALRAKREGVSARAPDWSEPLFFRYLDVGMGKKAEFTLESNGIDKHDMEKFLFFRTR